jgi:PAS domain S-box-containing protein
VGYVVLIGLAAGVWFGRRCQRRIAAAEARVVAELDRIGLIVDRVEGLAERVAELTRLVTDVRLLREELDSARTLMVEISRQQGSGRDPISAVVVTDDRGRIIEWSPGATLLFHWTAEEVLGKDAAVLVPPPLRRAHLEAFNRVLRERRPPRAAAGHRPRPRRARHPGRDRAQQLAGRRPLAVRGRDRPRHRAQAAQGRRRIAGYRLTHESRHVRRLCGRC